MIVTKEIFGRTSQIIERINKIYNCENATWEEKYDAIFSKDVSGVFFNTFPSFDYYDPDADYHDDVCAFVCAVNDFWNNIKVI